MLEDDKDKELESTRIGEVIGEFSGANIGKVIGTPIGCYMLFVRKLKKLLLENKEKIFETLGKE